MSEGEKYTKHMDPNLSGPNRAMEYNAAGLPALRVIGNNSGWGIQVSNGDIEGVGYIEKFGKTDSVPNGDICTVWDYADTALLYTYISAPSTVTVTSDDIDDNPTGAGARTINIQGLDENYLLVDETIPMNGTTTTTFIRIFRSLVATSGSTGNNQGNVLISATSDGTVLAKICKIGNNAPGAGQTFMCVYTVPAGKTAYLTQWAVSSGKQNADTVAYFFARNPLATGDGSWNCKDVVEIQANSYIKNYVIPLRFSEKTDIEVRASSNTGASCVSTFNLILIDNEVP